MHFGLQSCGAHRNQNTLAYTLSKSSSIPNCALKSFLSTPRLFVQYCCNKKILSVHLLALSRASAMPSFFASHTAGSVSACSFRNFKNAAFSVSSFANSSSAFIRSLESCLPSCSFSSIALCKSAFLDSKQDTSCSSCLILFVR